MQRKTAIAAATAISVTLLSATVGIGANLGALGLARPSAPTATAHVAANMPPSGVLAVSRTEGHERGEYDDGGRAAGAAAPTGLAAQRGGTQHD